LDEIELDIERLKKSYIEFNNENFPTIKAEPAEVKEKLKDVCFSRITDNYATFIHNVLNFIDNCMWTCYPMIDEAKFKEIEFLLKRKYDLNVEETVVKSSLCYLGIKLERNMALAKDLINLKELENDGRS
jgi:hypothetical protein